MEKKYIFKLYIAGLGPEDQQKILKLKNMLQSEFGGFFTFEVVNLLEHPELAEEQNILATPTFLRESPIPEKRTIINLSKAEKMSRDIESMRKDHKRRNEK